MFQAVLSPFVVSQSGFRHSAQPSEQVLNNEFIRVYHSEVQGGFICYPSYYDISEHTTLVYFEADKILQRNHNQFQCKFTNAKVDRHIEQIVPHCWTADGTSKAVQLGLVDTIKNRTHVILEGCTDNATDVTIYICSRLHHQHVAGQQLVLDAIQLHTFQPDDIAHNSIDQVLGELSADLINEFEDTLNGPMKPDELSSVAWSSLPADAIRTYDTWDKFLWNAHKFGIDYMSYDASRVVQRLVPVVERLRDSLYTAGQMDFYSGYWDTMKVRSAVISDAGSTVEVPKYVWLVARAVADVDVSPLVYVVPNGPFPVDVCTNRCDQLVHCCAISDIGEQVVILEQLFNL